MIGMPAMRAYLVSDMSSGGNAMDAQEAVAHRIKQLCDGFEITLGEFFESQVFDDLEQEIR